MLVTIVSNLAHNASYQILNAYSIMSIAGAFTSIHSLSVHPSQNCQRRAHRLSENAVRVRGETSNGAAIHLIKQ
jgi:hypothetical protein